MTAPRSSSAAGRASIIQFLGKIWGMPSTRRNPPLNIPPELIVDPFAPIPAKMSKRMQGKLRELREAYCYAMQSRLKGQSLRDPESFANLLVPIMGHLPVEHLMMVPLNPRLCPLTAPILISKGDIDGTEAGPRPILRAVLKSDGHSFIIAHNHPSGNSEPSPGDRAVTRRIAAAGRMVDCALLDHFIITTDNCLSLRHAEPNLFS